MQPLSLKKLALEKIIEMLAHASKNGGPIHTENVQTLLERLCLLPHQALPAHLDYKGKTPLILASEEGHTEIVALLLKFFQHLGTDISETINAQTMLRETALLCACKNGHLDVVALLLEHLPEADRPKAINHIEYGGNTPLNLACRNGHSAVAQQLLQNLPQNDQLGAINNSRALKSASCANHLDVVERLLNSLPNPTNIITAINHKDTGGDTALTYACHHGHTKIVQRLLTLLDHATTPQPTTDQPQETLQKALICACKKGHDDIVEMLLTKLTLENKATILTQKNQQGKTPFMQACEDGHYPVALRLLQLRELQRSNTADIAYGKDHHGLTIFMLACEGGCLNIVMMLFDALQSIHLQLKKKSRPVPSNIPSDITAAILTGIKQSSQNEYLHYNSLLLASKKGHTQIVDYLLQSLRKSNSSIPAAISPTTRHEETALDLACENGHTQVADLLLSALPPDHDRLTLIIKESRIQAGEVTTPLLRAIKMGHTDTVQLLLNHLQDAQRQSAICQVTTNGTSPLIEACIDRNSEMLTLLLNYLPEPQKRIEIEQLSLKDGVGLRHHSKWFPIPYHRGNQTIYTLLEHGCNLESINKEYFVKLISLDDNLSIQESNYADIRNKVLSIISGNRIDWVTEAFFDFANKNDKEKSQLHAFMKLAILFGQADLVTIMLTSAKDVLTQEDSIQHLYWALKANKFPVANAVISLLDEENKLAILDSVFTRLRQENFTCTQTAFTLYLHNRNSPKACPSSSTPLSHSLFGDATGGGSSEPQTNNHIPRHK